jgi:glutamate carboxypeptidase
MRALATLLVALAVSSAASADGVSREEARIVAAVDARQEAAVTLLAETVDIPSATENLAGVRRVGAVYARELEGLGFETRWAELPASMARAGHLVATHRGNRGKRLLLIGHLDTVLEKEPFRREGDRAYGSGVSDMKGGNLVIVEALRALHVSGALRGRQITVVLTGDEEDAGVPTSVAREALTTAARASDAALAFEGSTPGVAVVGRRGVGTWRLHVTGEQAHSSGIFREERGDGAIYESARIVARIHDELREPYLTINPSVIVGGTDVTYDAAAKSGTALGKTNVIPREVRVEGDIRYLSAAQFDSARERMTAIVAQHLPRTGATIDVVAEYPAMSPTDANRELLAALDRVSRDLGQGAIVAQDPAERGAGDVSFVAEGLACLDGLGADGGNEHAPGEYVDLAVLPALTRRAAVLIDRLTR